MGFLSSLFGNPDSLETRLTNEMAVAFQGIGTPRHEAMNMAREMVIEAKQEVAQRGWSNQSPNAGDLLLQQERENPKIHDGLEAIREDGVRDEDIRWWWNMHPLERVIIQKSDELNRWSAALALSEQGLDPEQVTRKVFAIHPKFGDPREDEGDDRPIPFELKRRIVEFMERHYDAPDRMREKIENASSFNAVIRAEIRAGTL